MLCRCGLALVWPGCGAGAAAGAPDTLVKAVDEALVLRRAVVIGGDADRAVTRLLTRVEQASLARRLDQIRAVQNVCRKFWKVTRRWRPASATRGRSTLREKLDFARIGSSVRDHYSES